MFLNIKAVIQKTSLSQATIYRQIKAGTFPKPTKISAGRVGWYEESLNAFLANLSCGRAV
jgi:prophage regulatory protein